MPSRDMEKQKSEACINITVPKAVHTAARIHGLQQGMTLGQVVAAALEAFVDESGKLREGPRESLSC